MALIPGYNYDLFISYAHADDIAVSGNEGWVAQLLRHLEPLLRQRLGVADELKIFLDNSEVTANFRLEQLLNAARSSALFLAISSPSYMVREWTRMELETFIARNDDPSRLFLIECLPLRKNETYHPHLRNNVRAKFWEVVGDRHIPMPLSIQSNPNEYSSKLHTLAADITEKLSVLRLLPKPSRQDSWNSPSLAPAARTRSELENHRGKTILLAQAPESMEDEADQLRNYLKQYSDEFQLLPADSYPQGGENFKAAFQADLYSADIFVQLLGKRPGRKPPDLPDGYTKHQLFAARQAGIPILQWHRPDLELSEVTDEEYRSILQAETVIVSGFEAFKLQLLKEVRKGKPTKRAERNSTVFINADEKDFDIAKQVERECLEQALTAILPMNSASSEAARIDLMENLTDCDMLVFIYGETTQEWIRGQLRFFNKIRPKREKSPKLLAICSGPPPKPEIGISFPDAHIIRCPTSWDIEPLRKLFQQAGE